MHRSAFFRRFVTVGVLLHAYVGIRLLLDAPIGNPARLAGALLLLLSCVLIPIGFLGREFEHGKGQRFVVWLGLLAMGFFSSLLVLTLLRDILLLLALLASLLFPRAAPTPHALALSAIAVPTLALLLSLVGLFNARRRAPIKTVKVPIVGLPAGLEGFSIVQISDVHVGPTIRRGYVEAIVDAVNRLDADLVAVTGDVVDGSVAALREHTAPLARLSGRHGVLFVTGNHEYYSDATAWVEEFARLGMRPLINQHVVIQHGGAELIAAGVTDYSAGAALPGHRSDPALALQGAPAHIATKVLLAHQPRSAPAAEAAGFTLQISGHTHGGQFLPWTFLVRVQQPFVAGLHRLGSLWVYTSRGTGYWGPPIRLAAPSEITHIRLMRAQV